MLNEAFEKLSPAIGKRYKVYLETTLENKNCLNDLHKLYKEYTFRDHNFPRPVLTFFGYFHQEKSVSFEALDKIGNPLFISQILRDFLAIHDDIVDEDIIKFNKPSLPVLMSSKHLDASAYHVKTLSKRGKDIALYYGDLIVSLIFKTIEDIKEGYKVQNALLKLINSTIFLNQNGQLRELLLQEKSMKEIEINEIIDIYVLKASYYCYSFPFEVGLVMSEADDSIIKESRELLLKVGAASQIVDDVVGAFPNLFDHGKDTIGELIYSRRTVPLVLLAKKLDVGHPVLKILDSDQNLSESDVESIKEEIFKRGILRDIVNLMEKLVHGLEERIMGLRIGNATKEYLCDLVQSRILSNANKFIEVSRHA